MPTFLYDQSAHAFSEFVLTPNGDTANMLGYYLHIVTWANNEPRKKKYEGWMYGW